MGCGASTDMQARDPTLAEPTIAEPSTGQIQGNYEEDDDLAMEFATERLDNAGNAVDKYATKENKPEEDGQIFELEEAGEGEQFMAVKPWIGALKSPSNPPENNSSAPQTKLELEYVNGYRCEDSRSNLYYTKKAGQIAYFTAAIGIVLEVQSNKQSFFGAGKVGEMECHNDDIESMDVCPNKTLAVTGQRGPNPLVLVWDIQTKEIKAKLLLGRGNRLAKCVKFSKDGKYVFASDEHNEHHMHAFDWASGTKVGITSTGGDPIMDIDTGSGVYSCVVASKKGLVFFTLQGGALNAEKGLYGSTERVDMLSVRFLADGNRCVSGAVNGSLYVWNGKQATKQISLHNGAIHTVSFVSDLLFTSGAKDKVLKVLDGSSFQEKESHQLDNYARAIDYKDGNILVGTRSGCIIEISNGSKKVIMNGHATGETWGLDIDHNTGNIVTTGDDNKIVVFDPKQNKAIAEGVVNTVAGQKKKIGGASTLSLFPPNQCSRAVSVSKHNGHVAIATNNGELSIRKSISELANAIHNEKISKEWIEVVSYSPSGNHLAVGSHDNNIYILDVNNGYQKIATCQKHNSFITSLDWSVDGQFIQSNCGAYEYLFFNSQTGQQVTGGATQLRDEQWNTFTCKLGWPVQGVFPPTTDGSHINGVDRSNSKEIIATGDDWGFINLYRNPCLKGNKGVSYRAHSSHVVRVKFDANDHYVYSVGGYDRTLMKWRVIN